MNLQPPSSPPSSSSRQNTDNCGPPIRASPQAGQAQACRRAAVDGRLAARWHRGLVPFSSADRELPQPPAKQLHKAHTNITNLRSADGQGRRALKKHPGHAPPLHPQGAEAPPVHQDVAQPILQQLNGILGGDIVGPASQYLLSPPCRPTPS